MAAPPAREDTARFRARALGGRGVRVRAREGVLGVCGCTGAGARMAEVGDGEVGGVGVGGLVPPASEHAFLLEIKKHHGANDPLKFLCY